MKNNNLRFPRLVKRFAQIRSAKIIEELNLQPKKDSLVRAGMLGPPNTLIVD